MYRETIYKYTTSNVNLREKKSTNSRVIMVIPKGSKIEVIDEEEDYLKVKYKGKMGYVYDEYISKSLYPWTKVNLRENPSTTSKSLGVIAKKERVEKVGNKGDWSQVIYNDKNGYIFSYYLSDDGDPKGDKNNQFFYIDMERFVNENNFISSSNYLLVTDLRNKFTYVFNKSDKKWSTLYKWQCTVGKPSTPTIVGTFYITGRKPYFGTDKYRVKYATRIRGAYYYHSILYDSRGINVIDGRLGQALSHGCIRLATKNAKWIYENIPDGTTVYIK